MNVTRELQLIGYIKRNDSNRFEVEKLMKRSSIDRRLKNKYFVAYLINLRQRLPVSVSSHGNSTIFINTFKDCPDRSSSNFPHDHRFTAKRES